MGQWNQFYGFPWREMNYLLSEMNDLFEGSRKTESSQYRDFPPVNIWSDENKAVATVEIPGIDPEKIELNVLEDTLILQGKREPISVEGKKDIVFHRQERSSGNFKRAFKLPFKVQVDQVNAKYEKGILWVHLPRSEQEKPKQIKVTI